MKDLDQSSFLLPQGFEDLLPPDAGAEFKAIGSLMACFSAFGYQRVKPPLLEFEESLLEAGPGASRADLTFRVMDPLSERMLALRSDITAQIARIAKVRLAEAERPLRLTYANDVVRIKSDQQRTLRQFCQVGCELIGGDDCEAVIETAVLALKGLSDIGLKDLSLDFSLPCIVDAIFEAAGRDKKDADALRAELSGVADGSLKALKALSLSAEAQEKVALLERVIAGVDNAMQQLELDVRFTIDPIETRGFEYHAGPVFTVFAKGVKGELGRGGCYMIVCDQTGTRQSAAGFTLYMDTVRLAMPEMQGKETHEVPADTPWDDIVEMQGEGLIIKRGF